VISLVDLRDSEDRPLTASEARLGRETGDS
jgi:hypothetical protein